jgi:N6-L-threonylcarbamoyladenine synthase
VIDALARRTAAALASSRYRSLGLSGGVARNESLRRTLSLQAAQAGLPFLPVDPARAGDNAAMIAFAAWIDPEGVVRPESMELSIHPSLGLEAGPKTQAYL